VLRLGSAGALAQAVPEQECARCGRLVCRVLPRAVTIGTATYERTNRSALSTVCMPLPAAETVGHRTAALLCRWPPQQRGAGASRAAAALLARARFPQYSNQAQRRQQRSGHTAVLSTQCNRRPTVCSGTSRAWAGTTGRSTPCLPTKTSCDRSPRYTTALAAAVTTQ
jgi:hypothetical protein